MGVGGGGIINMRFGAAQCVSSRHERFKDGSTTVNIAPTGKIAYRGISGAVSIIVKC